MYAAHSSIAYRKELPPQWTMGTIGPVWQKSASSKETTGPAQTNTKSEKLWKRTVENAKRHTRPLLEPTGFSQLFLVLTFKSDCCYHRLSVATVLHSHSYQRPLAEKAAGWICKFTAREEFFTRTLQQPLTASHRYWTYFKQAGTNGTPT